MLAPLNLHLYLCAFDALDALDLVRMLAPLEDFDSSTGLGCVYFLHISSFVGFACFVWYRH